MINRVGERLTVTRLVLLNKEANVTLSHSPLTFETVQKQPNF